MTFPPRSAEDRFRGHALRAGSAWQFETDDFERDFAHYQSQGVEFVREPSPEPYGTVAVFRDLYGNLWDLIGPPAAA